MKLFFPLFSFEKPTVDEMGVDVNEIAPSWGQNVTFVLFFCFMTK